MKVSPRLARLRRMLLRRYLADARLDPRQAAADIGYSPKSLANFLNGDQPISDMAAWRLQYRLGVPFALLEAPPLVPPLPALLQRRLETDLVQWRQSFSPADGPARRQAMENA